MIEEAWRSGAVYEEKTAPERSASRMIIIDEILLAMSASMRYKRSEIVSIVAVERALLPLTPTVDLVDVLADIEEERLRRARRLDQACPLWAMPPWPDQRRRDC